MMTGRTLGPYRVIEKLGAGAMGEVYKAHDSRLDRIVALKVLPPGLATADRMQRFEQEARAASALNHPNILTIHDVGREADVAWFATEWVDGQTLGALLAAGRLPIRRVVQIAAQVADGLAKAHAAGIVHRDLKPDNVMITSDGFVKIVDFGIAKLSEPASAASDTMTRAAGTSPGLVLGSVGYMSPEQASGLAVDYRSDQFALGVVIYEMATGKRPFDRATTAQTMAAAIDEDPASIVSLNPDVPAHLSAIVTRCLEKDPGARYESTRDLASDLKSVTDTGPRASAARAPKARSVAVVYAGVAVAAVAAAIGAAWLWTRAPAAPPAPPKPLVAVRAFRNLSADSAQGYFAAGVTEEIRGRLSQVSSLRLLSRNALEGADARAAHTLGVTQFVDGSVRIDGSRVRVTAELVDAASQQTLWTNQYDRELADVLAVQSDVAVQVAAALHASLSPGEQQRLGARMTSNAEAYELYLQSQALSTFDKSKNLAAIDMLRRALTLDPRFATAQARIAYRLAFMSYYDDPSYTDKGLAEAEAALRIDSTLPTAHFTIASVYGMKGMDAPARVAFLRTLELDPNHTSSMANLSILESNFGRLGESLSWARRMFALSGRRENDFYHVAVPLLFLRDDGLTRGWLVDGERRFPSYPRLQYCLAQLAAMEGSDAEAASRVAKAVASAPGDEEVKFARLDIAFVLHSTDFGPALAAMSPAADASVMLVAESVRLRRAYLASLQGDQNRVAALLAEAERTARGRMDRGEKSPPLRVEMAAAAALRGDHAGALEWLDRAYDAGFRDYGMLSRDPIMLKIEPAAKFQELLDRIRRDVEGQRERARKNGLLDLDALLAAAR
jgi:eukaryotic-like serine/threonine-protein kinase